MSILLSIITPCYNHGRYLDELLDSIHNYKWSFDFEHIIVNDGSTDKFTIDKIVKLQHDHNVRIINQENEGLANARNIGVFNSLGKYILPLDADNKLVPQVFEEGVNILEMNNELSVLFTDFEYFGERTGINIVGDFDFEKMLFCNYIDACALIRKQSLLDVGGYDSNMPLMGHEDWEIWLKLKISNNFFFYYPKIGFYYRLDSNSMSRIDPEQTYKKNKEYIFKKYAKNIGEIYDNLYSNKITNSRYFKTNKLKTIIKIIFNIDLH